MMKKTIALYHPDTRYVNDLLLKLEKALPAHRVIAWQPTTSADYLLTWKPDNQIFSTPGLQIVFALGAGVDALLSAPIPDEVIIARLEEAGMGKQMLEIALYGILHYSRDMIALGRGQRQQQWLPESTPKNPPFSTTIGVMGLGQLGGYVAQALANLGYPVHGYSYGLKELPGISCYDSNGLTPFLNHSQVLINLLPLTEKTQGILNKTTFEQLPQGAYLINIARGQHLQEADLIPAFDSGQLSGALLDVFQTEPLPKNHPFWHDDRIIITPHLAAITLQDDAVKQISRNIRAFEDNQPMTGVVDRKKGY